MDIEVPEKVKVGDRWLYSNGLELNVVKIMGDESSALNSYQEMGSPVESSRVVDIIQLERRREAIYQSFDTMLALIRCEALTAFHGVNRTSYGSARLLTSCL